MVWTKCTGPASTSARTTARTQIGSIQMPMS
jgi:hypothetical protein